MKAADVLHNVNSVLQDLDAFGSVVMKRFNAAPGDTLWYYRRAAAVCSGRLQGPPRRLADELDAVQRLAGALGRPRPLQSILRASLALLVVALVSANAHAQTVTGTVIAVHDGDTVSVRTSTATLRVRLIGIDCLEAR